MRPPALAVVGWSGSGKTTLLTRLVPELRQRGLRVGVVKHSSDAHPLHRRGSDTARYTESGAAFVAFANPAGVQLDWGGTPLHVHAFACTNGARVRVYVQAQDVIIAAERPRAISVRNVLEARVAAIATREPDTVHVQLDLGSQRLLAAVTGSAATELRLKPGRVVYALIKSVAI